MARTRDDVLASVQAAFPEGGRQGALDLLDTYGIESYERERERVQLAILQLSEGSEIKLREYLAIAKRDYRDVLFWAEYPEESRIDTPEKRRVVRELFEKLGVDPPADLAEPPALDACTGGELSMSDAIADVTTGLLEAFADAWNRHDADALMSFMTPDCVFESSAGPDVFGTRFQGEEAVRAGYVQVWTTFPDAEWGNARHFVCGNRGVSEWTFTGTRDDGTRVEVHGCDLFTFRNGKIALKDSYRKNRPPLANPGS